MKSTLPSVAPRITVKDNKLSNIQSYDVDNNYPGRIMDIIKASGTATSCANLYAKFINGKGFKDQKFWKSRVNRKGITVDKLLRANCHDISRCHGYALHINYNALFQVNEVTYVPFDYCRLGFEDDLSYVAKIALYDDWACKKENKIKKEKIVYIDVFNQNPDVILSQVEKAGGWDNYKGQIFWRSFDGEGYPLSICDPVIEDVIADYGIKKFRQRTTSTSFMPSHIIEYPYAFENEEERQEEKENWRKFQSTDESNKLIMMENPDGQDAPIKITKVDWQDTDKIYETTNRTVKDSIIECFSIPPVLLGVAVSGKLGTADEIRDAYMFYNSVTSDQRMVIEQDYTTIFSNYRNPINETGDYSIIPLEFVNVGTDEPALISILGVGGTQALTGILEGTLKDYQKINTLVIVFGLSHEDATRLVLGTPAE
jgi:hypothetical protein